MSRIGRIPVPILAGVTVSVDNETVNVEGPKGKLDFKIPASIQVEATGDQVTVNRNSDSRQARAFHGLVRSLINNMVIGVKDGYEKQLEVVGVGYICSLSGNKLSLRVGYANEIHKTVPEGLDVTCPDQTHIHIKGCDKQKVGQFAAEVRAARKPEPYKGKGVRYVGEQVKIKPGKAAS